MKRMSVLLVLCCGIVALGGAAIATQRTVLLEIFTATW